MTTSQAHDCHSDERKTKPTVDPVNGSTIGRDFLLGSLVCKSFDGYCSNFVRSSHTWKDDQSEQAMFHLLDVLLVFSSFFLFLAMIERLQWDKAIGESIGIKPSNVGVVFLIAISPDYAHTLKLPRQTLSSVIVTTTTSPVVYWTMTSKIIIIIVQLY